MTTESDVPLDGFLWAVINLFPVFAPGVAGPLDTRLRATMQAASMTFPLMAEVLSLMQGPVPAPVPIASFIDNAQKADAAARLKILLDRYGSDKASVHDYHLLYGAILADAEAVDCMLEIGIGTNNPNLISTMGPGGRPGASLRAFRDFLPRASIYGADIDHTLLFNETRIKTFFVDQTARASLEKLSAAIGSDLDLIIDDGLHALHANLATLLFALKQVKVGGWIVIEDIPPITLPAWQVLQALLSPGFRSQVVQGMYGLLFVVHREAAPSG